ncbi:2Fe-2S iron-sulfur cluster-binding protein [Pseudomonas sp. NMI542_15]|uniref:2Fe-2S iron-sulfur cluster-binding protein n=1 Tax=Pseudomonas sp. NMI542_15 TaxID=2903148 RepID=UPI001E3316C3|nr:2Fe-2S iron-sulfur cluster-binding protein [Pseudomonas sp. NMI542_15]MCE0777578.1 2Fe-2S iron-sulfur cluster-binding protein [Pseudomonas sp. NMI542_15]
MTKITFIQPDGIEKQVDAADGHSLMDAAIRNGVKGMEAECGGACSCATCHCYIEEPWFEKVGPAEGDEEGMLEFAFEAKGNSRLGCQVKVSSNLDGLVVRLPTSQG